jgi:ubiquinone/menaquinone biosynthesis C-methylase UbiE
LGDDTFEIAKIVGSQGRAVGIDVSETMILEARRRAVARGLPAEFEVGDAQALRSSITHSWSFSSVVTLRALSRRVSYRPQMLNDGGPICAKRMNPEPSFTQSLR